MKKRPNTLFLVIPCYNEEEMLPITIEKLDKKFKELMSKNIISEKSKVLFIDDGSKDKTWDIIDKHSDKGIYAGIKLAHNKGHQNAILAGMMVAKDKADMIISLDADLQDDINCIDKMINEYQNGSEIVYGVRSARKTDTFFKRFTAESFYKVMAKIGIETVYNHADYRLMSKRALDELSKYKEVNLFIRGIIPTIGLKTSKVFYERKEREAGVSKYPLKKMLALAWQGITSFSTKPIDYILNIGSFFSIINIIILLVIAILSLIGKSISLSVYIFISIWLICGIQLVAIGIVGEYIGKTYLEVKQRPRYIIETEKNL